MLTVGDLYYFCKACEGASEPTDIALSLPKFFDQAEIEEIRRAFDCDCSPYDYDNIAEVVFAKSRPHQAQY